MNESFRRPIPRSLVSKLLLPLPRFSLVSLVPKLLLGNAHLGSSASRSGRTATNVHPPNFNPSTSHTSCDKSRSGASKILVPKPELENQKPEKSRSLGTRKNVELLFLVCYTKSNTIPSRKLFPYTSRFAKTPESSVYRPPCGVSARSKYRSSLQDVLEPTRYFYGY
jgi:hypothetical protein